MKANRIFKIGFISVMVFSIVGTILWFMYFDRYESDFLAKNVRLELLNNGKINYYNAVPADEEEDIPTYYFRVKNNVNVPISYEILLHDVSAKDANDGCSEKTLFKREQLNYEVMLDNKVIKKGILSDLQGDILISDKMEGSKVNDYALKVWLNENAKETLGKHYHYVVDIREIG